MSVNHNTKQAAREKRHRHIRKQISGTNDRPRLIVYRSSKHIYAQIVDDSKQVTLLGVSTRSKALQSELAAAKGKVERARLVGKHLAATAKDKKIERIIFDRGGYLYHGRVKALAEGAREGGLEF
ncbi:MAG TPA: 50S ribosomal protein L18 [bacterium]|jgi:large subunit ribosomal protein L18|nr:50S ribosomal protein L18 [bacterium]HNT65352.1 50S ribosomal protein L18 [bacterium]HOX86520.1 50S ribosomal protein L18 [bacterium]HPG46546.1 50S ribosomal protein L18 [bacterium]HPM98398.1 50S ribosomal protein L18 [bacterium]